MEAVTTKRRKSRKKTSVADKVFVTLNTLFMIMFVIITLYPVLNTLAISLNDGTDALRGGIYLLPRKFTWKNYITVLQKDNLIMGAYITVARTVIGTALALFANAILAFIVSRKRFMFKKQLSLFWVITMYVNGGMIPTFLLFKTLHLTNSFWVYVIPGMFSAFNMLVIRTYMNGISDSLEESAQLCPVASFSYVLLRLIRFCFFLPAAPKLRKGEEEILEEFKIEDIELIKGHYEDSIDDDDIKLEIESEEDRKLIKDLIKGNYNLMKALFRIYNLTTHNDINNIRNVVSNYEGILACEINLNRKEVNIVYDSLSVSMDEIMNSIENAGYMIS